MPFFDEPDPRALARRTDPFTSHLAAEYIASEGTVDRNRVLLCHYMHQQGLNDFKMTAYISELHPDPATRADETAPWRKRRGDLKAMGFIERATMTEEQHDGSKIVVWQTEVHNRRLVSVWRITAKGIAYVETNLLR